MTKLRASLLFLLCFPFVASAVDTTKKFYSSDVSVTTTAAKVLDVDGQRNYLLIQNKGTDTVLVNCDGITGVDAIQITAGGNWEPLRVPTCSLFMKSASGSQTVHVLSGRAP